MTDLSARDSFKTLLLVQRPGATCEKREGLFVILDKGVQLGFGRTRMRAFRDAYWRINHCHPSEDR